MKADPLAAMRCWAVDIELGGQVYTVPPLPAADWWPILAGGDLAAVLGLIEDGDIDDRLLDESISSAELEQAFTDAVEEVSGRTLHEAVTIAGAASVLWSWVGGRLARYGFRWDVMPLAAALDAVHGLLMENLTEEFRAKYEALLRPPVLKIDREQAVADFAAVVGAPPPTGGVRMPLSSDAPSGDTPPRTPPQPRSRRPRARSDAPTKPPATPVRSAPAAMNEHPPAAAERAF